VAVSNPKEHWKNPCLMFPSRVLGMHTTLIGILCFVKYSDRFAESVRVCVAPMRIMPVKPSFLSVSVTYGKSFLSSLSLDLPK
jgi:hypothetical protein